MFDPTTADPSKGVADEAPAAFNPSSVDPAKGQTGDEYFQSLVTDDKVDPADLVKTDPALAVKVFKTRANEPITLHDVIHGTGKFIKGFGEGLYRMPLTIAKGIYGAGRDISVPIASAIEGKTALRPTPEQAANEPPEVRAARAEGAGALASLSTDLAGQIFGLQRNGSRLLSLVSGGLLGHRDKELSDNDIAGILAERAFLKETQQKIATGDVKGALEDLGQDKSAAIMPSQQQLSTNPNFDAERAAAIGATFNPENALPIHKALTPGMVAPIASAGLRATGNVIKGVGAILDNPLTRRASHYGPMYGLVHAATTGDIVPALKYAAIAGVPAVGKGVRATGEFMAQAGREMTLSPGEQAMFDALRSASGTQPSAFSKLATRTLQRGAAGAVSVAPFAASAQDPEEAGMTMGGGAGLGAVAGVVRDAGMATQLAARKALFDTALKTQQNGGKPVIDLSTNSFEYGHDPTLDQLHNSTMAGMSPEDVATINQWRHLEQGRTDIYVIPDAAFDARYPGASANGKADVINGRRVILYRGADGVAKALSHEPLHPVYQNLLPEEKAVVDKASLSRTDPSQFASDYYTRLLQSPTQIDFEALPDTAPNGPSKAAVLEEMAADTLRNLTIDQITDKPTLRRKLQVGIGKAMESIGLPTTTEEVRGILGVQPTFRAVATLEAALRDTAKHSAKFGPAYGQQPGTAAKAAAAAKAGAPPASTTAGPPPPVQPGTAPQQPATAPAPQQPAPAPTKTVSPVAISEAVKGMAALKFKRGEAQQRVAAAANEAAHLGLDVDASDLLAHALSGKFPTRTAPAPKPAAAAPGPATAPVSATSLMESVAAPGPEPKLAGLLWHKVLRGDVSLGDIPSQTLLDAREGIRTGTIKTADDFEAFLESKRPAPESKTSEPPVSARKPSATPPVQGGGMENAIPEAMSDDTAAAINRAGEEAARAVTPTVKKPRDIERARVLAMAEKHAEVATDPDLVTHRVDPFGKPSITGRRLDAADPLHNRLIQNAGLKPRDVDITNRLMADAGKNVALLDYGSAPVTEDISGMSRRKEQAIAPAQKRAKGESAAQHADKNFIPSTIVYNHGSGDNGPSILVRGFSPDKFLHNARQLFPWLEQKGFLSGEDGKPFYSGPDDPKLADDFRAMAENHANGYTGDGAAPVKGTPFTKVKVNPDFKPTEIPADRFRVVNALVGAPYPETGATPRQADIRALSKLNASEPGGNPIWRELGQEKDLLESTIENIKPELVGDLHAEADPTKAIRQSGRLEGAPRQTFSAAGFQPREAHAEAERLGLKYRGMTMGKLPTFDDPVTGSTITLSKAKTPEDVRAKIEQSRNLFRIAEIGGAGFMPAKHKDAIEHAALKMPDGVVIAGVMHPDAALNAREDGYSWDDINAAETGFVTSAGRFLTREEAEKHAEKIGQLKRPTNVLGVNIDKPTELESVDFTRSREFMPRGAGPAAEDIAEPPGLTRTPFKGATIHRRRDLEDVPDPHRPHGMLVPGNIDLNDRPIVKGKHGDFSTVRSISINDGGKEILIPTVAKDGSRILSDADAVKQYRKTGEHLGIFASVQDADAYAATLHEQQADLYKDRRLEGVPMLAK